MADDRCSEGLADALPTILLPNQEEEQVKTLNMVFRTYRRGVRVFASMLVVALAFEIRT